LRAKWGITTLILFTVVLPIFCLAVTNALVLAGIPLHSAPPPPPSQTEASLKTTEEATIIVLGAGVHRQELSGMLKCRMHKAIDLFARERGKKILLSGDGTDPHYNETKAMKNYALQNGLSQDNLLSDPLGYSTYDSLRRAIEVFGIRKGVIVTQDFHLKRSLWLANSFGISAQGVSCDSGSSSYFYDLREILVRTKDVLLRWFDFAPRSSRDQIF
jgi:SanA protein